MVDTSASCLSAVISTDRKHYDLVQWCDDDDDDNDNEDEVNEDDKDDDDDMMMKMAVITMRIAMTMKCL